MRNWHTLAMSASSLAALLTAAASLLGAVAAILHSLQTRRLTGVSSRGRRARPAKSSAQPRPGIDQNGLPGESGVYPPYQQR